MHLSFAAALLWAASFMLDAALLFVLVHKKRYRLVPWFTGLIAYYIFYSLVCFLAIRAGFRQLYREVYWSGAFLDFLLQTAVVLEIGAIVLRRSGRWVEGAKGRLAAAAAAAPAIALLMTIMMKPAAETRLDAWDARVSLFTTVFICLLFTAIMAASQQLGLAWRSHVMREGYGLTIWVLVAFFTDTLHAYWRTAESFTALEHIRMIVYLGVLSYWILAFWISEQTQSDLPSDMLERMKTLGLPIEYGGPRSISRNDGVTKK